MRHLFILLVLLSFMTGCAGIQTPVGTYRFTSDTKEEPKEDPKPKEQTLKERSGVSEPVLVLLGLGALTMLVSVGAMNVDDSQDHPEVSLILGGTGIVFWGAAGIVHLAEE